MTQPRRTHDAYAGAQTINSATSQPIVFTITYQGERAPLARAARGDKSPGQPGYKVAGWYWSRATSSGLDWGGPHTSSRAAFRAAVAALTR
jgi:hypothetical protein